VKVIISLKLGPNPIEGAEENAVYSRSHAALTSLKFNATVLNWQVRSLRFSNPKSALALKVPGAVRSTVGAERRGARVGTCVK
jgi:hypothetical protein